MLHLGNLIIGISGISVIQSITFNPCEIPVFTLVIPLSLHCTLKTTAHEKLTSRTPPLLNSSGNQKREQARAEEGVDKMKNAARTGQTGKVGTPLTHVSWRLGGLTEHFVCWPV